MKKTTFAVIGFLLLIIGMLSLVLTLVGVKLSFLTFIDMPGAGFGFLVRLLMVVGGIVIIVLSLSKFDADMDLEEEI